MLPSYAGVAAAYARPASSRACRAVAFYEHHGFDVDVHVDGLSYYRDHMGVTFPEDTRPFRLVLMRRQRWS